MKPGRIRSRAAELIDQLDGLPRPAYEQFIDYLNSGDTKNLPEENRLVLWNKLVDFVNKHRKLSEAKWAISSEEVDRIASVAEKLSPAAPFSLHQRLFTENTIYDFIEGDNYEMQWQKLEKRREEAIDEVASNGGIDAVLEFTKVVKMPSYVGIAFGHVAYQEADAYIFPNLISPENRSITQFVGGYILGRFRSMGWGWVDSVDLSGWTANQKGSFFSFLPFTTETWRRVTTHLKSDERFYWQETSVNPFEADVDLEFAIDQLIEYSRPYAAIRCFYKVIHEGGAINYRKVIKTLLDAVSSSEVPLSTDVYEITAIIKALQQDGTINKEELIPVEWAYLPLLKEHNSAAPMTLFYKLASDPNFFCEIIQLIFRSKKEENLPKETNKGLEKVASIAYELLSEWNIPPGHNENGEFDGELFTEWLNAVINECIKSGHLEIAMEMVGHVLIHAPADPDGLWIHRSIAKALNAKDAQDLRNGFHSELYNSRGVHWVDPSGKPERELAAKYRSQADLVENSGYFRLADTLRELASSYDREAERLLSRNEFGE